MSRKMNAIFAFFLMSGWITTHIRRKEISSKLDEKWKKKIKSTQIGA